MRKAKWTVITLGGIVLLLIAAVFVLTSVSDPNRYRGKIERIVSDLAGKPFVIEGKIAITWYPWLGIRTGPAHLDNPAIVEWQSINVAAKAWPLLHGEVVADRIRLQSPRIHLRRDKQGHGNWEGFGGSATPSAVGPNGTVRPATASRAVQIAGIEIRDGTVDYLDEASGLQATLANVELDVGEWRAGQPLPVHTRFLAHTQSLPADGVWVQLDAPALAIRPTPLSVSAPKLTLKIANAQADVDVTYDRIVNTQAAGGDLPYEQVANAQAATTRAHGSVVLRTSSLRELANRLGLNQTLPHDPTTLGPLELTTVWTYNGGSIAAKPLALKLDGVSFNGWLQRTASPQPMWNFELHGDRIDLGRYINVDSKNKKPFELPVAALRAINANGSLIFDQVVFADTHMADVRLKLQTPGKP